jgi:hypothetical protein
MPLFLQEAQQFLWSEEERKHQFLRRLTGKATQMAKHIGSLQDMRWDELFDLASKWYGHAQNKFHFQVEFVKQVREKTWTYSQFVTLLPTLAVKGYPERAKSSIEEMVLDRLVSYARDTDHLIYERYTQSPVTTVQDFITLADTWLAAFPNREPCYEKFWQNKKKIGGSLVAFTQEMNTPFIDPSRDGKRQLTSERKQGVNRGSAHTRVFRSSTTWNRQPRTQCPNCHAGYHWARDCPKLETRGDVRNSDRKSEKLSPKSESLNSQLPPSFN